jgi:hypothetical protein
MSNPPADVREAILSRLITLAREAGAWNVYRNRLRLPDEVLPAVAVLDGDEAPDESRVRTGRPANGPVIMVMRPEIYGFVQADEDETGPALSAMRSALLKAIMNDNTLLGLVKDGEIRYEGFATSMANGRSLEGEMGLALAFVYVLRPAAL